MPQGQSNVQLMKSAVLPSHHQNRQLWINKYSADFSSESYEDANNCSVHVIKLTNYPKQLTPKEFEYIMSLTSVEYLNHLRCNFPPQLTSLSTDGVACVKAHKCDISSPLFELCPSELVFQNYVENHTYELPLILRNVDSMMHSVHLVHENNPYFQIKYLSPIGHKIAAGLSLHCLVSFTPDSLRDYQHELLCITDRETYKIPIYCLGPRAILDFPDVIDFGSCTIKYNTSKFIMIRNVGKTASSVTLHTTPSSGETLFVKLKGVGQLAAVQLEADVLNLGSTYIGQSATKNCIIYNKSDVCIRYRWSPLKDNIEEENEKHKLATWVTVPSKQRHSITKGKLISWFEHLSSEKLTPAPTFEDMKSAPFTIESVQGEILPQSSLEFTVYFHPQQAKEYNDTLYCDIAGQEEGLKLHLSGTGLGPRVKFSFRCLDMGKLFIGAKHSYELVLSNVGCINATFCMRIPASEFSDCFTITPSIGEIEPNEYQAICVEFCSLIQLGTFEEAVEIFFEGCEQPENVRFCGTVVEPSFHFEPPELDFGEVSHGKSHVCFSPSRLLQLKVDAFFADR
ncbi:unnamed protein product [Dicrocoelium dendriticum]|nr:unnamed protein product [Dicrocoelium dendriticum]